jgi:hypothetical protein
MRFENLHASFPRLCERLNLSKRSLLALNQSRRRAEPISKVVREFVERYYEADFRLFEY